AVDRRLHLGLHLHRLGDQHGLTGLDLIPFPDQHINDIARHGGRHIAWRTGLLALATATGDELVERLEHHLFRHAVNRQVEVALTIALHTNAGDVHPVALAMYIDHELGRHTIAVDR